MGKAIQMNGSEAIYYRGYSLKRELSGIEKELITRAIRDAGWDRRKVAECFALSLRTLANRIRVLGIRRPEEGRQ